MRIVQDRDGLVIRLSAERDAVGELLRARVGELRDALAAHQVPVAELHVLHNPPATPLPAMPESPLWQERPWARREQEPDTDERPPARDEQDDTDEEG